MGRTCESKKRINPPDPSLMGNENLLLYRRQGPDGGSHNHTGCGLSKLLRAQPGILHCHMRRGQGKLHKPTCSAHIAQRQKLAKGSVVHLASIFEKEGELIEAGGYVCMFRAERSFHN